MKEMKTPTQKIFKVVCIIIAILIWCDMILTYIGLNLGFEEGNPGLVYLINHLGVGVLFVVAVILSVMLFFIYDLSMRVMPDKHLKIYIGGLIVIILLPRVFVVTGWSILLVRYALGYYI